MIRKARPSDAFAIAPLMMQAMEEVIQHLTGSADAYSELPLLQRFISLPDNQYSYQNTIVFESRDGVVGSLTAYDGAKLHALRQPVIDYLSLGGIQITQINDETEAGEFYIDTISVAPKQQGTSIGTQLLQAGIEWGLTLGLPAIGLLVNPDKPKAKSFYEHQGFMIQGIRPFMDIDYIHMIFRADHQHDTSN